MSRRLTTDMSGGVQRGVALLLIAGLVLSVVLAAGVSFYASSSPDGLETVAADQGFADTAEDSALADSPFADYGVSGVGQQRWSVALAGLAGVAVTGVLGFLLFRVLAARSDRPTPRAAAEAPGAGGAGDGAGGNDPSGPGPADLG